MRDEMGVEPMKKLVKDYMRKHQMLKYGDKVIAGISGGPDSMCMLHQLLELKEEMGIEILVVHVEHGIRGSESEEDARFVAKYCKEKKIDFYLFKENVGHIAKKRRMSIEEAGRVARYEAFQKILLQHHGDKIAVAHNLNDQAETVLFHLFRGTGIKGAGGIQPVNGRIIRPLLDSDREEILLYLKKERIPFRRDKTNDFDCYSRNKIRHHILPVADTIVSNSAVHLSEAAKVFREAEDYLEEKTRKAYEQYVLEKGNENKIIVSCHIREEHPLIQKYVFKMCIKNLSGKSKDIRTVHLEKMQDLLNGKVGRKLNLPYNINGEKEYTSVLFYKGREWRETSNRGIDIIVPGQYDIGSLGKISVSLIERRDCCSFPEKMYTKWLDYDKIKNNLCLRNRKEGDYITILKNCCRQKLKAYYINEKIPRDERSKIWLLADDSHIIWIIGYRISEYYKITEKTKKILKVQLMGGKADG